MPIRLTTPFQFSPGHGQAVESYAEVKVSSFHLAPDEKHMRLIIQYGNTIDGAWHAGKVPSAEVVIADTPEHLGAGGEQVPASIDFSKLAGLTYPTSTTERLYDQVARSLYQYLIIKGLYEGTIE